MSRDSDIKRLAAQVVTVIPPAPHPHQSSDVEGLQTALEAKADVHSHPYEAVGAVTTHEAANDPHPLYQLEIEKGQANGYASLGADGKVPTAQLPASQGGAAWGGVTGTLADQTDLQAALDAKAATGHNHDSAYAAANHTQAISTVTGLQTALDGKQVAGSYEPANANIQAHVASTSNPHSVTKAQVGLANADNTSDASKPVSTATQTALDGKAATGHTHAGVYEPANANLQAHVAQAHAPSNAQKNSDILKSEIEAVLTGEISTHTHAGGGGSPFMFEGALAADAATGANTTPISLTGLVFSFVANSRYWVEIAGPVRAAATTTGSGFQIDVSAAVTRVGLTFMHQLANTGTLSGGQSIADDASVGVSSGRPTANVDVVVMGAGYLIAGANAGTAQLRYRSEVAAVSTVMAGFMLRVRKLP